MIKEGLNIMTNWKLVKFVIENKACGRLSWWKIFKGIRK